MKDLIKDRHRRMAGGKWRPAAILLAAVLAAVSVPFFGKSVFAVDLSKDCSLTINTSSLSDAEQALLDAANVVVDVYRIADATEDSSYDTYHWELISLLEDTDLTLPEYTDAAGWRAVTQEVSDVILGTAPEGQSLWNPREVEEAKANTLPDMDEEGKPLRIVGAELGEKIDGLKPGLYFIVARGSDIDEYVSANSLSSDQESSSDSGTENASDGNTSDSTNEGTGEDYSYMTNTVTIATTSSRTYQFATELVAVPTKDARTDTGEVNTANDSEWIYDAGVVLKPAQLSKGGSVEIIKILDTYDYRAKTSEGETRGIIDAATFVFEVAVYESKESYEADPENAAAIYHNYISISFGDSGTKSALVENLPVGAYVVATEVYSGRSYKAVSDTTQTTTILPNKAANVTFENTYDGRHGGGGSVTNNFKYEDSGWSLEQVYDSSTEETHVSYPAQKNESTE